MADAAHAYVFEGQTVLVTEKQLQRLKRLDSLRLAIINNDLRCIAVSHVLEEEGQGGFWAVRDSIMDMHTLEKAAADMLDELKKHSKTYLNNAPAGSRSTATH